MFLVHLLVFLGTLLHLSSTEKPVPVDVLGQLKLKAPDCDLRRFVLSDNDSKVLTDDLTHYCCAEPKDLTKYSKVLCRMILYELKKACLLTGAAQPSPAKYDQPVPSDEFCKSKKILLTSNWIWKKLGIQEKNEWDLTQENFCSTLAAANETRRLVRFFYKIAPRVRQADSVDTGSDYETRTERAVNDSFSLETPVAEKVPEAGEAATAEKVVEKTGEKAKEVVEDGKAVVAKVKEAVEPVKVAVEKGIDSAKEKLSQTGETIKAAVGATAEKANQTVDAANEAGEEEKGKAGAKTRKWEAGPAVEQVKETVNQTVVKVAAKGNETVEAAKGTLGKVLDLAKDKANQTVELVKEKATDAKDVVVKAINKTGLSNGPSSRIFIASRSI